jgi:hypothetical protein
MLNVAIIHGIGINGPGYSKDLTDGIIREFDHILGKKLKTSADYSKDLNFIEIVWDDLLAKHQKSFDNIFCAEFERRDQKVKANILSWILTFLAVTFFFSFIFKSPWFFALLAFGAFLVGKRIFYRLRTEFAGEYVSDIISYRNGCAKEMIQARIDEYLRPLAPASGTVPMSFISHSLGTVIASDYVWDSRDQKKLFAGPFSLNNFFTMGSPLALFALRFDGPEIFNDPICVDDKEGVWLNIYDNDDPIAYPLKCLNAAYNKAVTHDREVNVGWLGLAHVNYWKNKMVQRMIAAKLAEDWMRLHK